LLGDISMKKSITQRRIFLWFFFWMLIGLIVYNLHFTSRISEDVLIKEHGKISLSWNPPKDPSLFTFIIRNLIHTKVLLVQWNTNLHTFNHPPRLTYLLYLMFRLCIANDIITHVVIWVENHPKGCSSQVFLMLFCRILARGEETPSPRMPLLESLKSLTLLGFIWGN